MHTIPQIKPFLIGRVIQQGQFIPAGCKINLDSYQLFQIFPGLLLCLTKPPKYPFQEQRLSIPCRLCRTSGNGYVLELRYVSSLPPSNQENSVIVVGLGQLYTSLNFIKTT